MSADESLFTTPVFAEGTGDDHPDEDVPDASGAGGRAQAVLEHVATAIVEDPGAVRVDVGHGRAGVVLSLSVGPADMGRIIGKRGRVAQALRTLVRAAAARDGTDATVDIVD